MAGPPLRIGMMSPYSLTVPGGVQAQVLGLAREMRAMGHEVRVLGPCDGPPPTPFVTPLGNCLPTSANGSIAPIAPDASASLRTIRAIRDECFDVLHLHEPLVPGPTMTALLLDTAPVIGTFHAAGDSASYRLLTRPLRWLAEHIDHRIAVSKDARALVHGYLGGDYEVLFNGVEVERFGMFAPWPAKQPTVFFCGRHEERKGLDVLLSAMGELPGDVRCWVASDGPDTARLKAAYEGDARIEWLGRITDEEKIARLRGADVFCAPSLRGESFGVVLLEAMAAGTPVVASALDGYQNVATDEVDGLLVPPGDGAALAAALRRVMSDPVLAGRLREAGEVRAAQFSMKALADAYIVRYREVLARPAPPSTRSRLRAPTLGRR